MIIVHMINFDCFYSLLFVRYLSCNHCRPTPTRDYNGSVVELPQSSRQPNLLATVSTSWLRHRLNVSGDDLKHFVTVRCPTSSGICAARWFGRDARPATLDHAAANTCPLRSADVR